MVQLCIALNIPQVYDVTPPTSLSLCNVSGTEPAQDTGLEFRNMSEKMLYFNCVLLEGKKSEAILSLFSTD